MKKVKSNYVAATLHIDSKAQGVDLPNTIAFYPVQLKFDSTPNIETMQKIGSWLDKQTAFRKVKLDNTAIKNKPLSNKEGQIDRHIIICEGEADPEWDLADGVKIIFAKQCNCGNRQGTCANNGIGGCLDGKLEGGTEEAEKNYKPE